MEIVKFDMVRGSRIVTIWLPLSIPIYLVLVFDPGQNRPRDIMRWSHTKTEALKCHANAMAELQGLQA